MKKTQLVPLSERFDETTPIPRGRDLYYECLICSGILPSQPKESIGCSCGNVRVDIDAFRVAIGDYPRFRILRRTKVL